jgi:hypothetical protein
VLTVVHVVGLSKLLSKLSQVISALPTGASTTEPTIAAILSDYIENYREDLPVNIEPATHPLVHLAYWHCRLVVVLLTPGATPAEIMWPTKELIELLSINADIRTPLAKHFSFLVALSLAKLCRLEASSEEAVQLAREILDKPGGVWDSIRDKLSERARPTSSAEAIASHGLQHLADLATAHQGEAAVAGEGETGEGPGAGDDDVTGSSLAQGYLEVV